MNLYRICSFSLALTLAACATNQPNSNYMDSDGYTIKVFSSPRHRNPDILRVIEQDQFRSVIVINQEANSPANQVGVTISAKTVENLLRLIKIRKQQDPEFLFETEEAKILSQGLAKALSSTKDKEDVVFFYPQERGFGLFKEHYMTTGRVFITQDNLNIVFGNIQQSYEGQWKHANVFRQFQPGSRNSSSLVDWTILNNKQAKVNQDRKDWVQISITPVTETKTTQSLDKKPASSSAEERLQKLLEIKTKGLIDEQEYQSKRQEILNSL